MQNNLNMFAIGTSVKNGLQKVMSPFCRYSQVWDLQPKSAAYDATKATNQPDLLQVCARVTAADNV